MKKILVIDDDLEILESVAEIIESVGFETIKATNGPDGLSYAKELFPDLVLCDIAMPFMDGIEVFERFISEEKIKNIPFIFLTAKADLPDIRKGMQLGADDYITKPFKAADLINSIKIRIERLSNIKYAHQQLNEQKMLSYDQKIFIMNSPNPGFIQVSSIAAIMADADYSNIILKDGSKIYIRRLLKQWEEVLPVNKFFRIHRSTIINLDYIKKIDKWYNRSYKVTLIDMDQTFTVSERFAVLLKKKIGI